jgi:hypothetical protein
MDFVFNGASKKLVFKNEGSDQRIVFFYSEPTADDRISYGSAIAAIFRDKELKEVSLADISKIQFQSGLNLLAGFETENIPNNISSNPESGEYREDWKVLIGNRAPDLVIGLCQHVFGEIGGFVPEKN